MKTRVLAADGFGESRRELYFHAAARALALFFGGFALLNVLGRLRHPGFDANLWWIDLRAFPAGASQVFLLMAGVCLVGFAVRPPKAKWRRGITAMVLAVLGAAVFWNVLEFYSVFAHGRLRIWVPIPLSIFILAALGVIFFENVRGENSNSRTVIVSKFVFNGGRKGFVPKRGKIFAWVLGLFVLCLVVFPVAQMICFGKSDYRRAADVAVVFGARAYKDGRPSDALADRVRTACQLYRDGLVKKLIFSGGPGDGAIPETEAMRRIALKLGVAPGDIVADNLGFNTQATVRNTTPMFGALNAHKVIVVSHFYHLPRIKLAYQRAGWEVYTVPAKETYFLRQTPYFVAREVAATWVYYLRGLA